MKTISKIIISIIVIRIVIFSVREYIKSKGLILLLLVSTNVFLEWTAVVESENRILIAYADYGTIKRNGNKVTMWKLQDFKTEENIGNDTYLSLVSRDEYDCENRTTKIIDLIAYSRNMGVGFIVGSEKNIKDEADSIKTGTLDEKLLNIACGKE